MIKKGLFFVLLTTLLSPVFSQKDRVIDLSKMPKIRNGFSILNESFEKSSDCRIVFSEGFDTSQYKDITTRLTCWFLNDKTIKHYYFSSEIKKPDPNEKYLLIGLFDGFSDLKKFKLPLSHKNGKYFLNNIPIDGNNDAIVTVNGDANCLAILGNSYESIQKLIQRWLGYFDYYVQKDGGISYFGNLKNGKFCADSLVDLPLIKKTNYSKAIENDYILAQFSCYYEDPDKYSPTFDSLNQVFTRFCTLFKVEMPSNKLSYFIHQNNLEINLVSGSPKPGITGGYVIDEYIHSVGMDINLLTHEGVHYLIKPKIKFRNQFFQEGIPQAFGLIMNPQWIKDNCRLTSNYFDYDLKSLITGEIEFFKGPYKNDQLLSYPFSGLFVYYLIETWGTDKTVEYCNCQHTINCFETVLGKPLDTIIKEWKEWIVSMTER